MSLCELCQSCDFINVPQLPTLCSRYPVPIKSFPSLIMIGKRRNQADERQPNEEDDALLGYPFHESFDALSKAVEATDCSTCKVVEKDVSQFRTEWTAAQEVNAFGTRTYKGPDWKMYIRYERHQWFHGRLSRCGEHKLRVGIIRSWAMC
jgi:hypothetical protein